MNGQRHDLTLHSIDEELYGLAVATAEKNKESLNKTFLEWAKIGAGLPRGKKRDMSKFVGMWTREEAGRIFGRIEEAFEKVDEEDWK